MSATKRKRQRQSSPNDRVDDMTAEDPVLSVALAEEMPPSLDISSDSLFEQMIYPITKETFASKIFRKKALHLAGQTSSLSERIGGILQEMHNLDPSYLMNETSSDNVFVWLKHPPNATIHSLETADPSQAIALHKAGHAIYCRAPPDIEQPMVSALLRGTRLGCGQYDPSGDSSVALGRGEVEVFIGTDRHITDWHFDFQENFTIQLSGTKKWTLQQGPINYPLRGCTPHYASPETVESQLKAADLSTLTPEGKFQFGTPQQGVNALGNVEQEVLKPGDILYFPAGMWHRVETVEPGVSINVSLMATNYAAITCQALQHLLLKDDRWRETLVGNSEVLVKLEKLLKELPETIQSFAANGGPQAILPPILRSPPCFENMPNNNDDDDDDDDDDTAMDNHKDGASEGEEERKQDNNIIEEMDDENELNHDDGGEIHGAQIIDVAAFEAPAEWSSPGTIEPLPNSKLILNPLAWVCKVDDVTRFYDPTTQRPNHYFININYAGNEMHEPAVRLVVSDEQDPVQFDPTTSVMGPREQCYVYHGLYVWAPK